MAAVQGWCRRGAQQVAGLAEEATSCSSSVVPGQDDALVLAVTVCIDHLTEHDR
jgi:hypothetical protein